MTLRPYHKGGPVAFAAHKATGLADADWVIEAVVEDRAVKKDLYGRLAGQLKAGALLSSNTSGLSVNDLAAGLAPDVRARFLGVHFFNPPPDR